MSCFTGNSCKLWFSKHKQPKNREAMASPSSSSTIVVTNDTTASKLYHKDLSLRSIPKTQQQLLIHAPKEQYKLVSDATVPSATRDDEAVIEIQTLGLNPIDWKGPAYNFGLPSFPCILGRDYIGVVVQAPAKPSRIQLGDVVLGISTDYRDYRKAAFQQFAVAPESNLCRLPISRCKEKTASAGVAFVTAALLLGISLGLRFPDGPDLLAAIRRHDRNTLAKDIREECYDSMPENERLKHGDWLAIWGAGSTVGFFALQLAKLAGVRVIAVADVVKRGGLLLDAGADVLVHRQHEDEAKAIVSSVTKNQLRYGVDTVGKASAEVLQATLATDNSQRSHIVGLTGLPRETEPAIQQHKVPIKVFHEIPTMGESIMVWMEDLLRDEKLILPDVEVHHSTGLEFVNDALSKLSSGNVQGQRIVVKLDT